MSDLLGRFAHLWKPKTIAMAPPPPTEEETQARVDSIRDMRVFIGTMAYKDYVNWLNHEIAHTTPTPDMGSDVGSCYTFKREGLIAARGRLEAMIRLAEERLGDG